jgi:hypothetical protein
VYRVYTYTLYVACVYAVVYSVSVYRVYTYTMYVACVYAVGIVLVFSVQMYVRVCYEWCMYALVMQRVCIYIHAMSGVWKRYIHIHTYTYMHEHAPETPT